MSTDQESPQKIFDLKVVSAAILEAQTCNKICEFQLLAQINNGDVTIRDNYGWIEVTRKRGRTFVIGKK